MALGGGVAATEEGINDRVKLYMHRCIMSRSKSMGGVREVFKNYYGKNCVQKTKGGGVGGSAMTKKTQLFPQKVIFLATI